MKSAIIAALLLPFLVGGALAADLPKATPVAAATPVACTATGCSGWYVGGQLEGAGPISTGQADLTSGAGLGAHVGYQLWNGSWFAAAEVGASGYFGTSTFVANNATAGDVTAGAWSVDYLAKAGYGLQGLFATGQATTPSQGLFTNLNASLISPYAIVGGRTRHFGTGFVSGAGIQYTIGNGWNVDVEYLHVNYQQQMSGIPIGVENVARVELNRMF